MAIKINPKLDPKALKNEFQAKGRIQIKDFLTTKDAATLHDLVAGCQLYKFKYNEGDKEFWVDLGELNSMTDRRVRDMGNKIYNKAMDRDFQYSIYACGLNEDNFKNHKPLEVFKDVPSFFDGKDMKTFIKGLTGDDYHAASAEAIWHKPDSFQTTGNGYRKGEKRVFGFALDLSRDWDADWGGNRFFRGEKGEVEAVYPSAFNSLTVFKVPTRQSISTVTGYGRGLNLSISGWLNEK